MSNMPYISVVIPVFNEEEVLPELYRRMVAVMEGVNPGFEIIFVDDGSKDATNPIIRELGRKDSRIKLIEFSRNFGHQIAITAGIDHALGEAVVIIDADLQDPPEVIPDLVAKWQEGYEIVYAVRQKREGEGFLKKVTATLFYRLLKSITNIDIPVDTGDFRLMDRRVVNVIRKMKEKHRFVRGMVSWIGFRQTGIEFVRQSRLHGTTKYPLRKMVKLAMDGMVGFSFFPLQLATFMGLFTCFISLIGIVAAFLLKFYGSNVTPGWASQMITILFIGGIQLFSLGIIGEYIGRIYAEVRDRPLYIIGKAYGWDDEGQKLKPENG